MSSRKRCLDWLGSLDGCDEPTKPATDEDDYHNTSPKDSAFESFTSAHDRPSVAKRQKRAHKRAHSRDEMPGNGDSEDELSGPKDLGDVGTPTPRQDRYGAPSSPRTQSASPTKRARQKRRVSDDTVSLSSYSSKKSRGSLHSASTDRSGRSTTTSSTKQVRQMNQLAALQRPVRGEELTDGQFDLLPDVAKTLVRRLRSCHQLRHVVPLSLKQDLLEHDRNNELWTEDLPWIRSDTEAEEQLWGEEPMLRELRRIRDAAQGCEHRKDLEAGWNSLSHGPLLVLACSSSPHRESLEAVNITSAQLLPHLYGLEQTAGLHKLVDFGIVLKPDEAIRKTYSNLRNAVSVRSPGYLNHTNSEQIAFRPLAISMETKQTHGNPADIQLRVWVTAQFHRLRELRQCAPGKTIICLPLLSIFGPVWHYIIARAEFDENGELVRTIVYSEQPIGDIRSYEGLLKVVSALLVLLDWAERWYHPWFEAWVTPVA